MIFFAHFERVVYERNRVVSPAAAARIGTSGSMIGRECFRLSILTEMTAIGKRE